MPGQREYLEASERLARKKDDRCHGDCHSTGLHFSAFTPTRVLVVSTVFANLDRSGKYRAVMSRHGSPTFYENISEQNYGSCDIGLSQLRPRSD
jgi:hypothetical protein